MKIFQRWGKTYPFLFQKWGKSGSILFQKGGKTDYCTQIEESLLVNYSNKKEDLF